MIGSASIFVGHKRSGIHHFLCAGVNRVLLLWRRSPSSSACVFPPGAEKEVLGPTHVSLAVSLPILHWLSEQE